MDSPAQAGSIEAKNISPGDIVVIKASNPSDVCAFMLPGVDAHVWVAKAVSLKVKDLVPGGDQQIRFRGMFFFNTTKDLTATMKMRSRAETISFGTWDILDVFERDEVVTFTLDDVANLEVTMKQILEREAKLRLKA
jgi:hypothetical protein